MNRFACWCLSAAAAAALVCLPAMSVAQGLGLKRYRSHALYADRTTLYCGDGCDLVIVDMKDLGNPVLLSRLSFSNEISAIRACRGYLLVATLGGGVTVFDTVNPTKIRQVSTFTEWTDIYGMDVKGHHVALAVGMRGVALADASDERQMRVMATFDTPGEACDVVMFRDSLLVADGMGGLHVAQQKTNGEWGIRQTIQTRDASLRVAIADGPVVILSDRTSLRLFEFANGSPELRETGAHRSQRLSAAFVDIVTDGPVAYAAAEMGGLEVLDCSRPDTPQPVGAFIPGREVFAVALHGDRVFLLLKNREIRVLDISSPARPTEVATVGLDQLPILRVGKEY